MEFVILNKSVYVCMYEVSPATFLCDCCCCSIEDAKQKAEHDRRMKAAEEKKQSMRHEILGLRKQFQQLVHKADSLPENLKLPKEVCVGGGGGVCICQHT